MPRFMWEWLASQKTLLAWLFGLSLGSLILTALAMPVIVVRLPSDYLVDGGRPDEGSLGWRGLVWRVVKNLLGVVFVLAGVAMLVLPGQGLLTILIGLLLMDFPGKRRLEQRLLGRPKVLALINRMRSRRGHPPLRPPPAD